MDQMKKTFKNIPILPSFMVVLLPSVILASVITISIAPELSDIAGRIKYSYHPMDANGNFIYSPTELITLLSTKDKVLYYLFECLSVAMWIMPSLLVVTLVPYLFYRVKIKKPLDLLLDSADKIANEDVNFVIDYKAKDEIGRLCDAFEKMRFSLEENNKKTWRMLEEKQKLNAVFAHDLRTPLTVLHGYSDFLMKYVPEGKISKEKLVQTIETMNHHIMRIENYVEHMNTVQRFDDITVHDNHISFISLCKNLQESIQILQPRQRVIYSMSGKEQWIRVDDNLIHQVFDNILANAIEYAENEISIHYVLENNVFSLTVSDDGIGFWRKIYPM